MSISRLSDLADERVGHVVVLADAEVEQRALGVGGQGGALGALDLLELVDLGALAVVGAADAVGEQGLEPGVAWRLLIGGQVLRRGCKPGAIAGIRNKG